MRPGRMAAIDLRRQAFAVLRAERPLSPALPAPLTAEDMQWIDRDSWFVDTQDAASGMEDR